MPSYTDTALAKRTPAERVQRSQEQERVLAVCLAVRAELDAESEYSDEVGAYINPELIMGAGVVTPPGLARYARPYASMRAGRGTWADMTSRDNHAPPETLRQLGTYGWAVSPFGDADTATLQAAAEQGVSTVTVSLPDGTLEVRQVSEYSRKRRENRKAREGAATSVAERRAASDAAAMAAIGADTALADGTA